MAASRSRSLRASASSLLEARDVRDERLGGIAQLAGDGRSGPAGADGAAFFGGRPRRAAGLRGSGSLGRGALGGSLLARTQLHAAAAGKRARHAVVRGLDGRGRATGLLGDEPEGLGGLLAGVDVLAHRLVARLANAAARSGCLHRFPRCLGVVVWGIAAFAPLGELNFGGPECEQR